LIRFNAKTKNHWGPKIHDNFSAVSGCYTLLAIDWDLDDEDEDEEEEAKPMPKAAQPTKKPTPAAAAIVVRVKCL